MTQQNNSTFTIQHWDKQRVYAVSHNSKRLCIGVRSLLYTALDIGYIAPNDFERLSGQCTKAASLVNGFIRYLKQSERKR